MCEDGAKVALAQVPKQGNVKGACSAQKVSQKCICAKG